MNHEYLKPKYERYVVRRGTDECWAWTGSKNRAGYGQLNDCVDGVRTIQLAHRVSFELHTDLIPAGLKVLHKCDNPECTNPNHLFLGTNKDNSDDRDAKNRVRHGETHPEARVTEADVIRIRELAAQGLSRSEIAPMYNVKPMAIYKIVHGITWKRVPGALPKDHLRWRLRGERSPVSKLTDEQIAEVRQLRKEGKKRNDVAKQFGVCVDTITNITQGRYYRNDASVKGATITTVQILGEVQQ